MARLRVRIELNRRMAGVPLEKMASVVEETRKFFYLLSEDVHIQPDRGEWLASDFDAESLNFTAEYAGPVTVEQVHAFSSAFAGATSLRKTTIAQFTRIAEFLGEDELVGFGLYQSDQETEPAEWRCLSKRDAMRFGEEIKLLAEAAGEQSPETQLPAVNGSVAGRRLFKDRREREALAADPSKVVREMESNLARRISALENEVAEQTRKLQQFTGNPPLAEERFERLLSVMETFWAQAPRQLLRLPAPEAPPATETRLVPTVVEMPAPVAKMPTAAAEMPLAEQPMPDAPLAAVEAKSPTEVPPRSTPAKTEEPQQERRRWSVSGVAVAVAIALLAGVAFPGMQHEWVRYSTVQTLPLVKPKTPAAPALTALTAMQPVVKKEPAQTREPFLGPSIPLDIPARLKPKIQSEVRVNVLVAIDQEGKVTGAHVESTKGDRARLLVTEALRAARQSRFHPAREGEKTVESQMLLTFLFKPESNEF